MAVEVDVHAEVASRHDLVKPATVEVRIRDQPRDTGEPLQEVNERRRIELREELQRGLTHAGLAGVASLRSFSLS